MIILGHLNGNYLLGKILKIVAWLLHIFVGESQQLRGCVLNCTVSLAYFFVKVIPHGSLTITWPGY